jgi:NADH-quinone oxidoreductase subunit L
MMSETAIRGLIMLIPGAPLAGFLGLGAWSFLFRMPSERIVAFTARVALTLSWLASLAIAMEVISGRPPGAVHMFDWFQVGTYTFSFGAIVDELSAGMLVMATAIIGLISRFAENYLHREPGFVRFYLLLLLFTVGMTTLVSSSSYDQLFIGWELVGITSVLLIAYFHERHGPVKASLRVLATYRFADVGLLLGAVYLHQALHHHGANIAFSGSDPEHAWPKGTFGLEPGEADVVVLLFLLACAGKSALFPLGGWLGRAMEGPTPSSALFYGALSVHGGVYLMLRSAPILEEAHYAPMVVVAVGALTAAYGSIVSRVQSDVKNALAFSTMSQLGLMYVFIGLGWYRLAAVHLFGHAILRAWQMLRTPSALRDALATRNALSGAALHSDQWLAGWVPEPQRRALFALALDRFHVDAMLEYWLVRPVLSVGSRTERFERAWAALLSGWGAAAPREGRLTRTDTPAPRIP